MYKYKLVSSGILKEEENKAQKFHDERIKAFDVIETRLDNVKKLIRQGKIETIKYYRENPDSFAVVMPTDLINDYIKDIEILLNPTE